MTALEVSIDGMSGDDAETWQWQLPDIKPGQVISFRVVEAPAESGVPPQIVCRRDPRAVAENKREVKRLYEKAKREMALKKRKKV